MSVRMSGNMCQQAMRNARGQGCRAECSTLNPSCLVSVAARKYAEYAIIDYIKPWGRKRSLTRHRHIYIYTLVYTCSIRCTEERLVGSNKRVRGLAGHFGSTICRFGAIRRAVSRVTSVSKKRINNGTSNFHSSLPVHPNSVSPVNPQNCAKKKGCIASRGNTLDRTGHTYTEELAGTRSGVGAGGGAVSLMVEDSTALGIT